MMMFSRKEAIRLYSQQQQRINQDRWHGRKYPLFYLALAIIAAAFAVAGVIAAWI